MLADYLHINQPEESYMTTVSTSSSRIDASVPSTELREGTGKDARREIDPAALRADLSDKAKLLRALESKGIKIDQLGALKQQIATAIEDLDAIIENIDSIAKENEA